MKQTKSKLILLFNTDDHEDILGQLGKEIDLHSWAGQLNTFPSMIIVNKDMWTLIEAELQLLLQSKKGYASVMYRGIPIVPIDGDNIISHWVED